MAPAAIVCLLLGDAFVVTVYVLSVSLRWWKRGGVFWKTAELVDLNGHGILCPWYLSCQLFLIACLFALYALRKLGTSRRTAALLFLAAAVFTALSFEALANVVAWVAYKAPSRLPPHTLAENAFYIRDLLALAGSGVLVTTVTASYWLGTRGRAFLSLFVKYLAAGILFVSGTVLLCTHLPWSASSTDPSVVEVAVGTLARLLGVTGMLWITYDLTALDRRADEGRR